MPAPPCRTALEASAVFPVPLVAAEQEAWRRGGLERCATARLRSLLSCDAHCVCVPGAGRTARSGQQGLAEARLHRYHEVHCLSSPKLARLVAVFGGVSPPVAEGCESYGANLLLLKLFRQLRTASTYQRVGLYAGASGFCNYPCDTERSGAAGHCASREKRAVPQLVIQRPCSRVYRLHVHRHGLELPGFHVLLE